VTAPRTRPGGGQLTGSPTDLANENRELHQLRSRVPILEYVSDEYHAVQQELIDILGDRVPMDAEPQEIVDAVRKLAGDAS